MLPPVQKPTVVVQPFQREMMERELSAAEMGASVASYVRDASLASMVAYPSAAVSQYLWCQMNQEFGCRTMLRTVMHRTQVMLLQCIYRWFRSSLVPPSTPVPLKTRRFGGWMQDTKAALPVSRPPAAHPSAHHLYRMLRGFDMWLMSTMRALHQKRVTTPVCQLHLSWLRAGGVGKATCGLTCGSS